MIKDKTGRAELAATITSADIVDETIRSIDIKNGEVKTADLANGAVTAAKIKDGEVKPPEIATDAVGGDELRGVTELLFFSLTVPSGVSAGAGGVAGHNFFVGIDVSSGDSVVATLNAAPNGCFHITQAEPLSQHISIEFRNGCNGTAELGGAKVSAIVFDR